MRNLVAIRAGETVSKGLESHGSWILVSKQDKPEQPQQWNCRGPCPRNTNFFCSLLIQLRHFSRLSLHAHHHQSLVIKPSKNLNAAKSHARDSRGTKALSLQNSCFVLSRRPLAPADALQVFTPSLLMETARVEQRARPPRPLAPHTVHAARSSKQVGR